MRRKFADNWAMTSMMGFLYKGPWNARIVHSYPDSDQARKIWGPTQASLGTLTDGSVPDFDVDLVICPCEGMRDLLTGYHGGSVSVLAGGPRGAFATPGALVPQDDRGRSLWYFVLTSRHEPKPGIHEALAFAAPERDKPLQDVLKDSKTLTEFVDLLGEKPERLLMGTMALDQPTRLVGELRNAVRLRLFHGSSVAAALTAHLLELGVDAFAGLVNPGSMLLMAAAAKATGHAFFAIPCRRPKTLGPKENKSEPVVLPNTKPLQANDVVPGADVFVVATGITEHLLMKGVRFAHDNIVSTETICLRSSSRSHRTIRQRHNLSARRFHLLLGKDNAGRHLAEAYSAEAFKETNYDELRALMAHG